jgi:hypothetical protein
MRFTMPLLRRFFGKLVHDILPAALASLLGGFLITHFQLNRPPEPVTVPVARASPEMMQLLRDEHGLIGSFVQAQIANEKNAIDKSADEKKQLRASADDSGAPAPAEAQPSTVAAARPTAIVAVVPGKPAPARVKPLVIGASLPTLATPPVQQSENAPPPPPPAAASNDSLLAKTIGLKDNVVAVTQRAAAAIGGIPSWFGAIGDRIGGEDPNPRPPAHLISEL